MYFSGCLDGEHLYKELYLNDQNIRNIVYCTLPHLVFLRQWSQFLKDDFSSSLHLIDLIGF